MKITELGAFAYESELNDNYEPSEPIEKSCDTCQCNDDSYCVGCKDYSHFTSEIKN